MALNVGFVIAALCVAAFFAPLLAEVLGVPSAVVELLMGFGLSFLVPASALVPNGAISNLGGLGFLVLMFLVGLEIDLRDIWSGSKSSLFMGVGLFAVSLVASVFLMGHLAGASTIWILAGAATSVGVAAPVLYSHGWSGTRFGRDVLVVGSVAEILYLVVLTALSVANRHDSKTTTILLGVRTTLFIGFALVLVLTIRKIRSRAPRHFHRWFRRDDPIELGLRGAFAMLFVVVACAGVLHIPDVLGSLLAGIVFRIVIGNAKAVVERLTSVATSFFIPIFFLTVGLQTHVRAGVQGVLPTVGLVLCALSVSRLVLIPYLMKRGDSFRQGLAGSFLLMAPLTLLITTAEIGSSAGLIGPRNASALILTAAVSALIFPVAGKRLLAMKGSGESTSPRVPIEETLAEA